MSGTIESRILLVEDDPEIAKSVCRGLDGQAYLLHHAGTLKEARNLLAFHAYDAMLLDLGLPDGSGLELARELRGMANEIPILMLTARDGLGDRLAGFGYGADDYLCKPFEVSELIARLSAVLRRSGPRERARLSYAGAELDLLTLTLRRGDVTVTLSAREFELLAFLLRHPEEVMSRERLLEEVWGAEGDEESNVVNVYINYLRTKLEQGGGDRIIHTVRGAGYMLSAVGPDELR